MVSYTFKLGKFTRSFNGGKLTVKDFIDRIILSGERLQDHWSSGLPIFFKLGIRVDIGKECLGIADELISTN